MPPFSEQVPPHALEAEQAVIGACLESALGRMTCVQQLSPDDFYSARHRRIFEVILELDAAGPVNTLLVANRLRELGYLEECGGFSYLMSCINLCPTLDTPDAFVALVKEKSARRRLLTALAKAKALVLEESRSFDEVRSEAEALVLGAHDPEPEEIDPEEWARQVEVEAAMVSQGLGGRRRVKTGLRYVDSTLKLWPRKLTTLAGGTSQGKTATALAFTLGALRQGYRVYYWSGEMAREEIWSRMAASELGIRYEDIEERRLTLEETQRLTEFMRQLEQKPLVIVDTPRTVANIRAECRQIAHRSGQVDLVVIDYLGLLADLNREVEGGDRRDVRVGMAVWNLRQLARELDCHVLMVAQFNREPGKRTTGRPRITDLKDSSAIEQHSDSVVLVYRPERDDSLDENERQEYAQRLELIIAKQRSGKTGSVWLQYQADLQRITSLHHTQWPDGPPGTRRKST